MLKKPIIPISFLNSQTIEKSVSGRSADIDITTQFNSLSFDMPEFAIVLFQTDRSNNQLKDSSFFDHCKVRNIFFRNGRNETFPNEAWNLDIDNHKYLKMYDAYTVIKRVILKNTDMILSPKEFFSTRPMYVINTSNRRETIVKNKTNIKVSIDFSTAVPSNTLFYVMLSGGKKLNYDIVHEKITEVF